MSENSKIVIGFITDLFTRVSIEGALKKLGYQPVWWDDIPEFVKASQTQLPGNKGEHLTGPGFSLTDKLTQIQPQALIFDLTDEKVPWEAWISMLKSASATRRLPILSFGPHIDVETLQRAKKAGSEMVIPRSALGKKLADFFVEYGTIPYIEESDDICQRELHPLAIKGIEAFNSGEYFDAHEYLEDAWMSLSPRESVLYRSLLQVAVIYYQIRKKNYNGALKVYLRVRQWLSKLPDRCQGVDVAAVKKNLEDNISELKRLGKEEIGNFDMTRVENIKIS